MSTACATAGGVRGSPTRPKEPLRGGVLEFRLDSYDGRMIEGRLLVGTTIDPLAVDTRLIEWTDVELENLHACGNAEPLEYLSYDIFTYEPKENYAVLLRPGSWYGGTVNFLLFNQQIKNIGLPCFDA